MPSGIFICFDCPARTVTELELQAAVVQAVNEVYAKQEVLLPQMKENIERALANNNSGPVAELNDKIAVLGEEILQRSRARQDLDDLGEEVIKLKKEKYRLQLEDAQKEGMLQKLAELERTIEEIGGEVEEYDEMLVRRLIERITVYDEKYVIEFKSGIEIEV